MNEWKRCLRISSGNLPGVGGTQPLPRPCGDVPCSTLSRLTAQTGGRHEHTHRNTTHKKRNEPLFRSMSATSQSSAKTKQTFLHLLHPVMPPSVCPDPPILFPFSGACPVDHPFSLLNVQFPLLNCILTLPYKHVQACTVGKKRKKEEKKKPFDSTDYSSISLLNHSKTPERAVCLILTSLLSFSRLHGLSGSLTTPNQVSINSL